MKRLIKMPSIEQFRNIVSTILRSFNFVGMGEDGEPIYDHTMVKPVITFTGTVKLHGTNASVCLNKERGFWVQSKGNIITPQNDNAGFAFFAETKKESFVDIMEDIALRYDISLETNTITLYGEWCGKGVQKKVAISEIDKAFFLFGVKVTPHPVESEGEGEDKSDVSYWLDSTGYRDKDNRIFNIDDYGTYTVEVDFNRPDIAQNKFVELTIAVEDECPVGKAFGISGIGEGIVWNGTFKGSNVRFKTKGEKHASGGKTITISEADSGKIEKLLGVARQVTPAWRLEQMLAETFDTLNGGTFEMKGIGLFIKAVMSDIVKEEMLLLSENDVEPKDIGKYVSVIAKEYFIGELNTKNGL